MYYIILVLVSFIVACGGTSTNMSNTFLEYSLMNVNSTGVIVNNNNEIVTKWQRTVISPNSSVINWGAAEEIFYWDNNWIYLDKYRNPVTKQEYDQYVTKQEFCQYNTCTIISNNGKQKYAPLNLQNNYTLDTVGYIVSVPDTTGTVIKFRHFQSVTVDVNCSNPYYTNKTCIIQNEQWYDDNQTDYSLKLDRSTYYAKGLGIGFIIQDRGPNPFLAYLK